MLIPEEVQEPLFENTDEKQRDSDKEDKLKIAADACCMGSWCLVICHILPMHQQYQIIVFKGEIEAS